MIEVFYAILRDQAIDGLLHTVVATLIARGNAGFRNGKLKVRDGFLPKDVERILETFRLGDRNTITREDLAGLWQYLFSELVRRGFVARIPLLGPVRNMKFRAFVRAHKKEMIPGIRDYVRSGNLESLERIDPDIARLRFVFPKSDGFRSFYKDSQDIYRSAQSILHGSIGQSRYERYYTESGETREIE